MSYDRQAAVERAFSYIAPRNPLNQLDAGDREFLWALLKVHSSSTRQDGVPPFEPLEKVHKLMADAAKLAKDLELEVFGGACAEMLLPYTVKFRDLPSRIIDFSTRLKEAILIVGKPGYQQKVFANLLLVQASEFVLLKTGRHYDEHLAELFQGIADVGRTQLKELSGDAIRKQRTYLAANYPDVYAYAVAAASKQNGKPK
jgi:hypothetical protein